MTATTDWWDAVARGDVEALRWHLDAGMDVDARDGHGQTAVMTCAHRGYTDAVRLLIERGAALDGSAKYGLTATMLAALGGHVEAVRALAEAGADLDVRATGAGFAEQTALALARGAGHDPIVAVLEAERARRARGD